MWIDGDVSALVKRFATHRLSGFAADPDRQQDFSVGSALSHGMVVNIGEPDAVVGADRNAVGPGKNFLVAPAMKKFAAVIQDDDRGVAAVEHVDVALGIDGDAGDVVGPFVGHLAPFFDYLVKIIAAAGLQRHLLPSRPKCRLPKTNNDCHSFRAKSAERTPVSTVQSAAAAWRSVAPHFASIALSTR